jgi:hypothetical protein
MKTGFSIRSPEVRAMHPMIRWRSARAKAAEGRRTPRRFAHAGPSAIAPASWSAPALWRFSPHPLHNFYKPLTRA